MRRCSILSLANDTDRDNDVLKVIGVLMVITWGNNDNMGGIYGYELWNMSQPSSPQVHVRLEGFQSCEHDNLYGRSLPIKRMQQLVHVSGEGRLLLPCKELILGWPCT